MDFGVKGQSYQRASSITIDSNLFATNIAIEDAWDSK